MHERPDLAGKERAGKAAVTGGSQQSSEEGDGCSSTKRRRAEWKQTFCWLPVPRRPGCWRLRERTIAITYESSRYLFL